MDSDPSELFKTSNSYFEGFPTQSEWQFMTSFSGNLQSEPSECPTHMPEDGLPRQHHCTNASMDSVRPKPSASRPAANELLRVASGKNTTPHSCPLLMSPSKQRKLCIIFSFTPSHADTVYVSRFVLHVSPEVFSHHG
jgi:hypothetical protein